LSKVTVNAIPSTYIKPTAIQTAATYTPTTFNQTIAAGTYCSGVQTIKGDANLKAENIAEGISIFGITGTHSGGGSGSSVETCLLRLISITTEPQTVQVIASVYETGTITTANRTHSIYFDEEQGTGSVATIRNIINNTPVTLVFSGSAPNSPIAEMGDATFICNNGKTISFVPIPYYGECSIRL
jgi:hypothetical protein